MTWMDSLMSCFGYAKAQSKPTSNPQQVPNQNPLLQNDQNLNPDPNSMPTNPMGGVYPEQQSGNPSGPSGMGNGPQAQDPNNPNAQKPNVEIQQSVQVPTPFGPNDKMVNSPTPTSTQGPDVNPTGLKPQFTVDDLDMYHPKLGISARNLGIKTIDKDIFLESYNLHVKKATLARKPLSEYFDEIL